MNTLRKHRVERRWWSAVLVPLAALTLLSTSATVAAPASSSPDAVSPPEAAAVDADAAEGDSTTITLVTGDVVAVDDTGELPSATVVEDVEPIGDIAILVANDDVYAVPGVAVPMLAAEQLDRELFNLSRLVRDGYTDADTTELPVIVTYESEAAERQASSSDAPDGSTRTDELESADAAAMKVHNGRSDAFWADVTRQETRNEDPELEAAPGIEKIWLDQKVTASLDVSRVTVGADRAAAAGYAGEGQTIAVLDTGIDDNHPDLAGKVVTERSFIEGSDPGDRYGHGTHVASIIAGTGAASDGRYMGVAPEANLINGKVLDDRGNGPWSAIIAGMEWAAEQADVVNMSLGGDPSNGQDPVSQALNEISDRTGTLFVTSAGNDDLAAMSVGNPAAADSALAVAATGKTGERIASYSSVGPRLDDFAVKPEISGPGSGVLAARAGSEGYVGYSGTSMAAPHVTAAAAILLQKHPDMTVQQLRDTLISTANPTEPDPIWWQGAGVVDIGTAVTQDVHATGTINLGIDLFPQEPGDTLEDTITYTNTGTDPVTLDLHTEWTKAPKDFGRAPVEPWTPDGAVSVTPASVTVAPGGSTTATLSIATDKAPYGTSYGRVVATAGNGSSVHTTVGFTRDVERHRLALDAVDRDGLPVQTTGWSFGVLQSLDSADWQFVSWKQGKAQYNWGVGDRLEAGRYAFMGYIGTFGPAPHYPMTSWTVVAEPEIVLDRDRTYVLDAREAGLVDVQTQRPSVQAAGERYKGDDWQIRINPSETFRRVALRRGGDVNTLGYPDTAPEIYSLASQTAATAGTYRYQHNTHRTAPPITMRFGGRTILGDYPDAHWQLEDAEARMPRFPARQRSTLVDVGMGSTSEIEQADVAGRFALLHAPKASEGPGDGLMLDDVVQRLSEAGAVGVVVPESQPGSGNVGGYVHYQEEIPDVPVAGVSYDDGQWLTDLVANGPARLSLRGIFPTPYTYDLMVTREQSLPNGLIHHPRDRDLAAATAQYRTDGEDRWSRVSHRPAAPIWALAVGTQSFRNQFARGGTPDFVPHGFERTEFYTPNVPWTLEVNNLGAGTDIVESNNGSGACHRYGGFPLGEGATFEPGQRTTLAFGSGPWVPGEGMPGNYLCENFIYTSSPGRLNAHIRQFTGPGPTQLQMSGSWYSNDMRISCAMEGCEEGADGLYKVVNDTDLIESIEVPPRRGNPGYTAYNRFKTSTRTHTEWTVNVDFDNEFHPGVLLDWWVDTGLDTVVSRHRPHTVKLTPSYGTAYTRDGGADHGPFTVKLWATYDDGETWQFADRAAGIEAGEAVKLRVRTPRPDRTNGFVGYRAVVTDSAGNAIDQTVIRAARTVPRPAEVD